MASPRTGKLSSEARLMRSPDNAVMQNARKTSSVMASREIGHATFPVRGEGFERAAEGVGPYGEV